MSFQNKKIYILLKITYWYLNFFLQFLTRNYYLFTIYEMLTFTLFWKMKNKNAMIANIENIHVYCYKYSNIIDVYAEKYL